MANVKITELTATTDPVSTDVLPIVDVGADTTKKVTIADLLENAGNGSAGAPAFSFDSDPDTGMYRAGTNLLGFATVGVGRVFIAANGDLGHGTSNPGGKVHVESPSGAGWQFRTDTTGLSNESGFFRDSSNQLELVLRNADGGLAFLKNGGGSSDPHLLFHIGTTEKLRIDNSGRLLAGTSSARTNLVNGTLSARLQVEGTDHSNSSGSFIRNSNDGNSAFLTLSKSRGTAVGSNTVVQNNDELGSLAFMGADGTNMLRAAEITGRVDGTPGTNDMPGRLVFSTTADGASSPSERMRITEAGHIMINQSGTPTPGLNNLIVGAAFQSIATGSRLFLSRTDQASLFLNSNSNSSVAKFNRSGTEVGSISVTTTTTAYNTSSDYRLKENVVDIADGITRVKQLAPKRFNFIADAETTVDGFLAHEAQTVVPEAVTGTHNEVDDDGNAVMQGIDQSKLVPLLTAALQEAIAKIETLEQRLTDAGL